MEDEQIGRQPKWKTTKMEDNQNERRTTSPQQVCRKGFFKKIA